MADAILEGQQGVSNEEVAAEQNIDLDEKRKIRRNRSNWRIINPLNLDLDIV